MQMILVQTDNLFYLRKIHNTGPLMAYVIVATRL